VFQRLGARRPFAHQQAGVGDLLEQPGVAGRIGAVDAAGQHGDGAAGGGQGRPVRRGVDAEGAAGNHGPALLGQAVRDVGGHVQAVAGGCPGADHRDRAVEGLVQRPRAAHPQAERRGGVPVDPAGPVHVQGGQ
jgi:hypothetical protein